MRIVFFWAALSTDLVLTSMSLPTISLRLTGSCFRRYWNSSFSLYCSVKCSIRFLTYSSFSSTCFLIPRMVVLSDPSLRSKSFLLITMSFPVAEVHCTLILLYSLFMSRSSSPNISPFARFIRPSSYYLSFILE